MQTLIRLQRFAHKTTNDFDRYYLVADDEQFFSLTSHAEGFDNIELAEGHQYIVDYYVKALADGREFKNVRKICEAYDLTDNQKIMFLLEEMNRKLNSLMQTAPRQKCDDKAKSIEQQVDEQHGELPF